MTPSIGILGGGILGVVTAYRLNRALPEARITIYDRGLKGGGASRRSAGVHFPFGRSRLVREMTRVSEAFYRDTAPFARAAAIQPVALRIGTRDQDISDAQACFTRTLRPEAPASLLERTTRGGEVPLRFGCEGAHHTDVHRLVQDTAAALGPGVTFREGIALRDLAERTEGVRLSLSDGGTARHDVLVMAPGPWSVQSPVAEMTRDLGLRIKRVVALHIPEPALTAETPLAFFPDDDAFLLPRVAHRHWLFSYANTQWEADPDAMSPTLSGADLEAGRAVLARIAPDLVARCDSGRVFCDTYTPERVPRVTTVGAGNRVIYAGGANGSGYRLAPAMAGAVLDLASAALGQAIHSEEAH